MIGKGACANSTKCARKKEFQSGSRILQESGSGLRMASKQRIGSKDSQARVKLAQFEVVMVT